MDKVKAIVEAGVSIPVAVREALSPQTLREFAEKYAIPAPVVSDSINGNRRAPSRVIDALIAELGGTPEQWRELLWEAGRPDHLRASA